jgi:hypothetical protein
MKLKKARRKGDHQIEDLLDEACLGGSRFGASGLVNRLTWTEGYEDG